MAREKKNYVISKKHKTITAQVATLTEADIQAVKNYIALGYTLLDKKPPKTNTLTIEQMRAALAEDEETLKAFNAAYEEKTDIKKPQFKDTGFAKACKIYNDWKKANK